MEISKRSFWCVIPAAGRGTRCGDEIPKQYRMLAGQPMLQWTLQRLAEHPQIAGLMVVLAPDDAHWPGLLVLAGKPIVTAQGGSERADSVLMGLRALPPSVGADNFVLVHDAARPCVRMGDITSLLARGIPVGGALLAAPLRDTLKRADSDNFILSTEPREARWRALTPQLFRRGELTDALESANSGGVSVTDEAMAMERIGHRPLLVEGAEDNIKVTTPSDFALAEFILTGIR